MLKKLAGACFIYILEFFKRVKLPLCLSTVPCRKTDKVEEKLHTLLTSTLDGSERSSAHSGWKEDGQLRLMKRKPFCCAGN
jgi:hypothetical protein